MTDQEKASYAHAVWETFCEVSRQERLMGPTEFSLIRHWFTHGYPLRIVLRGIRDVKKHGRFLVFYEKPVEAAMAYWERAMAS